MEVIRKFPNMIFTFKDLHLYLEKCEKTGKLITYLIQNSQSPI